MGNAEPMNEFVDALCHYVAQELRGQDGEYIKGAVRVIDARNHCFQSLPHQTTDEAADIYAFVDLCFVDDTMHTLPDRNKAFAVARNYF